MYSIGTKIPKWNEDQLHVFDDFVRTCAEILSCMKFCQDKFEHVALYDF